MAVKRLPLHVPSKLPTSYPIAMATDVQQVHLRLPAALHKAAQRAAEENDRSFSSLTRVALTEYLASRGYLSSNA